MCNGFEQEIAYRAYVAAMELVGLGVPTVQTELDLPPREHVHIRDDAAVVRAAGNGVELALMRFGFPPTHPRGGVVFNFRAEARRFASSNRCLIPASAFFEYTGAKSPKDRHRFTAHAEPFFCIAGLWRTAADGGAPNFTMLTVEPGPDVAPYHDRQIVVLPKESWGAWLSLSKPESDLLTASPAGTFDVLTEPGGRARQASLLP
jgi:putative SOS response-associated peptidase YedK